MKATPSPASSPSLTGSPVVLAEAALQIQGRQLETPLSTADSSEVVAPKVAHTLGPVGLGWKASSLYSTSLLTVK